ncbi:hypothetical protein [Rhizobium mongolense]|uniref:DNA-directed RNA polymerase subunit omega n=2 Tax=Rhizobium mongolense TaxID=57676 RepID=A0ABR6IGN8_9HYPH|nr:hypothetical protein [Rhizobium mongolense]MBB4227032.1 DNA-directed RNA polymerase subunit omega [Rhizobium mongolense]TVZ74211.1 DNA-directed RNA polymerase subunit omega [Rhizobium mongolense USDA 1844]
MDPHVVFDCQKILPNKFVLAVAAAACCRALNRGAKPRVDLPGINESELALQEIASGVLAGAELALFVSGPAATAPLPDSNSTMTGLRGDGGSNAAAAPVSCSQEAAY